MEYDANKSMKKLKELLNEVGEPLRDRILKFDPSGLSLEKLIDDIIELIGIRTWILSKRIRMDDPNEEMVIEAIDTKIKQYRKELNYFDRFYEIDEDDEDDKQYS